MDDTIDCEAKTMFAWESDPYFTSLCTVIKDSASLPSFKSLQELQQYIKTSNATHFGIYQDLDIIGEFNFIFNHPALLKSQPKTAWLGIGIGEQKYRRNGYGARALGYLQVEVAKQGGERIEVGVFEFSHAAIGLYKKMNDHHFHTIADFNLLAGTALG